MIVYDIVEVSTLFGYSLIGKLKDDNEKEVVLYEPLLLVPAPQTIALKPLGNVSLIDEIKIQKSYILGYSKINDPGLIKKYQETFDNIKVMLLGLEIVKDSKIKLQ